MRSLPILLIIVFILHALPSLAAAPCSMHLLNLNLPAELKMNAMGMKLVENPELIQKFIELNKKRDEFDMWFDKQTDVGAKQLTESQKLQADKTNLALIREYKTFADSLGIESEIIKVRGVSDITETSALKLTRIDHPYFSNIKKRQSLTLIFDPLRSFLLGGYRGSVALDYWGHTYLHLYDFPLLMIETPIHGILVHEMSHVKTLNASQNAGIFSKTGRLLAMGGRIDIKESKRSVEYYRSGFSWDEINAYIISLEETVRYLKLFKQLPQSLEAHHPLSIMFASEISPKRMNSSLKILGEILDSSERVLAQVQKQFQISPTSFPEFSFDTGVESGIFYLSYESSKDILPMNKARLENAIRSNLEVKKEIIIQARKEMADLKAEWDRLQSQN